MSEGVARSLILVLGLTGCVQPGVVGTTDPTDRDEDGSAEADDCNDLDPTVYPGAPEGCDGIDSDCDGVIDTPDCVEQMRFTQSMRLDLLVVMDTSCSMVDAQDAIAASFGDLLQHLVGENHDTHVGVVTMDMDSELHQGRLVEVDDRRFSSDALSFDDAMEWSQSAIRQGVDEMVFDERGMDVVDAALHQHHTGENVDFRREDAHLSLLFVSDEDDASELDVLTFLDRLRSVPGASDATVHAVVSDDEGCLQVPGESYLALAALTGGTSLSVCEPDYGGFLSAVGQMSARQGLLDRFDLDHPAQDGTIEVGFVINGVDQDIPDDNLVLTNDGQTVWVLGAPPPIGSEIRVVYRRLEPPTR